ncbi:trafficking protein particle complex subunit 8-like [Salvia hispanica]|uniref:trafficking protein particle complex subunit 8-like n=1 Tax=Salvia hispanica TaxID=49212 RepID=UPI002008F763|nr:trafficking protein particle complex subunit 8-like [Salvia hispanica]
MVDPANTKLGRMLLDQISPAVMVLRTPLVEDSCRRNHLSLIEMLSPYSTFNNIDVPVRTASDQPYRLRKFKLRLFYNSDIRQRSTEAAKERLKQVITHAGDKEISDLCSPEAEIESVITMSAQELVPSWFQNFNKELIDAAAFSEHEAFDHPVACLVAVSTKDKDPIGKFVDLFNTTQLPHLLNDGSMDPKILKYYLLVHDNQEGMQEKATGILAEMRSTFGASDCRLLCINSSVDGTEEHQQNSWASHENSASNEKQFGCFLNKDDIEELRNTMHDFSSKHIIPLMELKIRVLNQQVSATRKGFRNQIKNLWWRKGKDDVPENPSAPMYTFNSTESQIRVLGDYAFMLRDYELALSNYRLISTDYKLDKALKHYAGVQEMMGLAYFMLDQSRKDAEYCMENAFTTYAKIGSSCGRNVTRCGIWWAEMLKARDQYKDAAGVYFRISGEEPLNSAVMLEQAAYCFLMSTPAMLRKYGFHLVLSGDLYKKCDQIKHAVRTYKGALSVFKGTAWSHIRDHVHFHIGKWYAILGMFDEGIKHVLEVLACGHQAKLTQELFLSEFFQIIQETGKIFEVLRLQLPVINFPSIKVVFEDHRTYASPAAANVEESLWQALEEDMTPSVAGLKSNWLDLQSKILPKKYKESNVCIAGEAIKVEVSFRNPLQIPISVSNVSLICKHSTECDKIDPASNGSLDEDKNDTGLRTVSVTGETSTDASFFDLSEVNISMQSGETVLVQLTVTPKVEGTLKLVGVRWKLSGSVIGICNFQSDIVRKKVAKGKRKPKKSLKDNLEFLVIKSLPRLEGTIHNLPQTVYTGDLRRLTMELRNPSKTPVKNLKMKINHPRFLDIADQEVMNLEFPTYLKKQAISSRSCTTLDASKTAKTVFMFPENIASSWQTPIKWPLWFRAAASGSISLCITIYYETEDVSSIIKYRTLRMHYNVEVLPSLEVSYRISPSPSRLHEFLVRMDATNRTSSQNFQVHQLSCVVDQWELALLQPMQPIGPNLSLGFLMAGQSLSCFFRLKNCKTRGSTEDKMSFAKGIADVRLVDSESSGLFDTSVSPFDLFHHQERLHQERHDKGDGNTVDFILIAESQDDSDAEPPRTAAEILSHYACHCRVGSSSPVWWSMDGPRSVNHDFSSGFCEINLNMTVYNSLEDAVSVRINTLDSLPRSNSITNTASVSGYEYGWHDASHLTDAKVTPDSMGGRVGKALSPESVSPFIWSGSCSTRINLEPLSSAEVPLQISVFCQGTFDLSNYSLQWNLLPGDGGDDGNESRVRSGSCHGRPYHITVLQKEQS